jgi:hypothetical protein
MTSRLALLACAIVAASALAACAPLPRAASGDGPGDGKAASGTGITFFGDARLGVAYGPDGPGGKSRTRIVAE